LTAIAFAKAVGGNGSPLKAFTTKLIASHPIFDKNLLYYKNEDMTR
jgi:hypothetical protein